MEVEPDRFTSHAQKFHEDRRKVAKKHFPDVIDRRRRNPGELLAAHACVVSRCLHVRQERRDVTLTQLTGAASSPASPVQRFLNLRESMARVFARRPVNSPIRSSFSHRACRSCTIKRTRAAILRLIVRNEFNEIQKKIVTYVTGIIRNWIDGSVETRFWQRRNTNEKKRWMNRTSCHSRNFAVK